MGPGDSQAEVIRKREVAELAGLTWIPYRLPDETMTGEIPSGQTRKRYVKVEISWGWTGQTGERLTDGDWSAWRQAQAIHTHGSIAVAQLNGCTP